MIASRFGDDQNRAGRCCGDARDDAADERMERAPVLTAGAHDNHFGAKLAGDVDELLPRRAATNEALHRDGRKARPHLRGDFLQAGGQSLGGVALERGPREVLVGMRAGNGRAELLRQQLRCARKKGTISSMG